MPQLQHPVPLQPVHHRDRARTEWPAAVEYIAQLLEVYGSGKGACDPSVSCGCRGRAFFQQADFLRLFPDGVHCVQELSPVFPPGEDAGDAKQRHAHEVQRIKQQRRKEARPSISPHGDNAPVAPLVPPTAPPPRDDIYHRIQAYQDRRLLEEKEKDERIARERAAGERERAVQAEQRVERSRLEASRRPWESKTDAGTRMDGAATTTATATAAATAPSIPFAPLPPTTESRAQAVRNAAVAVHDTQRVQELEEKAAEERERVRREAEEKERVEQERLQRDEAERARLQREHVERQRREREQAEGERLQRERAERETLQREQTERERLQREHAERERLQREQAERERLQREYVERDRLQREQLERDRMQRQLAERQHKAREQDLARQDQQLQTQAFEEAKRQQAWFLQSQAQREQAQREQVQREQAQREQAQREQAQREQVQREQVRHLQTQREQVQREQAQREQAQREQAQREQAERQQAEEQARRNVVHAQEQLARERAQREQAEESKRRADLAAAQAQEQRARERAQHERVEEQRKQELALKEQNRRAQADEAGRRSAEAIHARMAPAPHNAPAAETPLSRTQNAQSRNSLGEHPGPGSQHQEPSPQIISVPQSPDIMSASGLASINGQPSAPGGPLSGQLVNTKVLMELQSAMIAVQSQIIAIQSKLYQLQADLNSPDRSIVKHVEHNLLKEQLQSMVNMYNKIQVQIAARHKQSQAQVAESPPFAQTPAPPARPPPTHQFAPDQRPHVSRQPFRPQQVPTAAPFAPTQRPPQPGFRPQMRPGFQSSNAAGPSPTASASSNAPTRSNLGQAQAAGSNRFGSPFTARPAIPRPLPPRSSGPVSQPRPAQPSLSRRIDPIRAQPVPSQVRPNVPAMTTSNVPLGQNTAPVQAEWPRVPTPSGVLDSEVAAQPSILSPSDPPAKTPPVGESRRKAGATKAVSQETPVPVVNSAQSKVQDYLQSHSLAARAQLLAYQDQRRSVQTSQPWTESGGLARAMSNKGRQPMQITSNGRPAMGMRSNPTALRLAQRPIPAPFDPCAPYAMLPSSFILGGVSDIVPLPVDPTPNVASRFTEIPESPKRSSSAGVLPDESRPALPSSRASVGANPRDSSSTRSNRPSPPVVGQSRNSSAPTGQDAQTRSTGNSGSSGIQATPGSVRPTTPHVESIPAETLQDGRPLEVSRNDVPPAETIIPAPEPAEMPVPHADAAPQVPSVRPVEASPTLEASPTVETPPTVENPVETAPVVISSKEITPSAVIGNDATRTRQRSDSVDEQAGERPTKRRRIDQSRFIPPRGDVPSSPNRSTNVKLADEAEKQGADKPSWKTWSDSSGSDAEGEPETATVTTTVVLDKPAQTSAVAPDQAVNIAPSAPVSPSATFSAAPLTVSIPTSSPSQQAAQASSVRLTLEKVFQKNPNPSNAAFDKLASMLKIEDVEPLKKLFALWRQNGHQPNTNVQN
ncbi:hypothetical protein NliqN6_1562 [Naganishia liquefaciens]|uniref:Uncharacterized protein n=1 Tax=Naganishia liquefaciens TaxID=104408 RepID=A0A8H3TQ60_9TREE|nr:hypothetical protein NliqN6_1562 [Naganishia liquefaciens]